jgi:fucose 4-O-acetylase-like acetyltransferase
MSAMDSQRIVALDVAKGLGILLVVLGHNDVFRERAHSLYEAIYLFHMPLFFFLAGVTFRGGSVSEVVRKRARSLLVPYAAMSCVAVALAWQTGGAGTALSEFEGALYGTGHTIRFVPLWFLPCLFITAVFATVAWVVLKKKGALLIFSCLCVPIGAWILDSSGRPPGLPWSLDLVPFVSGLFLLGALMGRAAFGREFPHAWLIALGGAVVLALLATTTGTSLDLNYRRMNNVVAVIGASAAGIAMVVALSHAATRFAPAPVTRLLAYLGSASLFILMVHAPLQRRVVDIFEALGVDAVTTVTPSVVLTVGIISAIDYWVLRRVRAFGWVVYPRRAAASAV